MHQFSYQVDAFSICGCLMATTVRMHQRKRLFTFLHASCTICKFGACVGSMVQEMRKIRLLGEEKTFCFDRSADVDTSIRCASVEEKETVWNLGI